MAKAGEAMEQDARTDLGAELLIEHVLLRGEGHLAQKGALVVETGAFTGRSPKDKYIVQEPTTQDAIWWGTVNQPLSEAAFARLHRRVTDYLQPRPVYTQHLYGGADERYQLPVRIVTEFAWHSLFARQLLIRGEDGRRKTEDGIKGYPQSASHNPEHLNTRIPEHPAPFSQDGFTLLVAPGCKAVPAEDGTRSETFIALNLRERLVLIGGTEYAGEIKKSVFTLLNYLLPQQGVFPMHCSANIGRRHGDTALFFGLSGTGKTTLSADPTRDLIGDDEHGWSDAGVFNFEGGCYAKCIRLSEQAEPQIWSAIRFGTVLENVEMDPISRGLDFDSERLTENTRAAYPIDYIPNARIPGIGGHPRHVVFLTADAFGVLPPISRLTSDQAMYHFLSGYTAKIAGTERGMGSEPQATFSACFGQPFLPLPPTVYARLLGEKLAAHGSTVWLVNTGWSGGPYGVGNRMNIVYTRAMLNAAIEGELDGVAFHTDPVFNLQIPEAVPGVPTRILTPRQTWADTAPYDTQAQALARLFSANFAAYRDAVTPAVFASGPTIT